MGKRGTWGEVGEGGRVPNIILGVEKPFWDCSSFYGEKVQTTPQAI